MWQREDHKVKPLRAGDVLTVRGIIDITPRHKPTPERAPVPEQDVREVVRAGRHRAATAFKRDDLVALAFANEALEPLAKTWWARLMRRLRGMVA